MKKHPRLTTEDILKIMLRPEQRVTPVGREGSAAELADANARFAEMVKEHQTKVVTDCDSIICNT